ncbi:DUF2627 domain-containing protein [Pseudescherichia sp.]
MCGIISIEVSSKHVVVEYCFSAEPYLVPHAVMSQFHLGQCLRAKKTL